MPGQHRGEPTGTGGRADLHMHTNLGDGWISPARLIEAAGQRGLTLIAVTDHDHVEGARRVANYLRVLTMEAQTLARACGKSHLRNLEPEDLVALTVESAAMARVPLAGTNWIPGAAGHV